MAEHTNQPIVFLPDGIAQCMACENICDMNADLVTIEVAELKRLRAIKNDLLVALKLCASVVAGETMHKDGLVRALEAARSAITSAEP